MLQRPFLLGAALVGAGALALTLAVGPALAAAPPSLGTAQSFAVLAGSTVTNTGATVLSGDLGVSPGTAITGFPPGIQLTGGVHAADPVADQAQTDAGTAYDVAAALSPTPLTTDELGGQLLVPGVYSGGALALTGTLTLDAQGDPSASFVFQAASSLVTASSSRVLLINEANPCNVFWQVGSSATLGSSSQFAGTLVALTSVTANTLVTVEGRLIAREAAVTLDETTVSAPTCTTTTTPAPTLAATGTPVVVTASPAVTATPIQIPAGAGSGSPAPDASASGPTVSSAGGGAEGSQSGPIGSLPATGANMAVLAVLGLVSVLAGSMVLLTAGRKRIH